MNDDIRPGESGSANHADAARRDYVPGEDEEAEGLSRVLLDSFDPVDPDPAVWTKIASRISNDANVHDAGPVISLDRRRRFVPGLFAVAAVFLAVLGTVVVIGASGGGDSVVAGNVVYELTDPESGSIAMTLTVAEDGSATASAVDLAALGDDQTYQLWSVVGDEIVSAGLLGADPEDVPVRIEGDPAVLALTVEVAGGVAVSEATPVAVWQASS